jgi:hypothetical protein
LGWFVLGVAKMPRNLPDGQITRFAGFGVSSPPQENISLCPSGKSSLQARAIPPRSGGALAIVTNVGRDAVDVLVPEDERRKKRTAKSCGLGASTLASTRQECFRILPGMVTRKPDHQREHEANRKTIAQGRPDVPVNLW